MCRWLIGLLAMACTGWTAPARGAVWQFAVDTGVKEHGQAFLWIPPECETVRGLIVGQQVILEKLALEDPQVRAAAAREDLAILCIVPAAIGYDDFGPEGKGEATYGRIVEELAEVSGYSEIARAPFLTIGHSGGALAAWRMAYWRPERCFGVIGLRAAPIPPPAHEPKAQINGVPVLVISGQYETWDPSKSAEHHWRWCRGDILAMRAKWDAALMSVLVQPGAGHFNWDDKVAEYVAMFIEKAAQARLPEAPEHQTPVLSEAEGLNTEHLPQLNDLQLGNGWLTDHTLTTPVRYPTAAFRDYTGDPTMAFWHLDEALARANEVFGLSGKDRKLQLVTFLDDGKPLEPAWMQELTFQPGDDGVTMRVQGGFVEETPITFRNAGYPEVLEHADGPMQYRLIGGWSGGGIPVGADTFRIKFDRFMLARRRENASLMVMAHHPGNADFGYAEQPASISFPFENRKGTPQTITFDPISDQPVGTKSIVLQVTSDAGLPVAFCVIKGPARVEGDRLVFTKIPPRTTFPVRVTVAAYQWGRSVEPLVPSAAIVERSFHIKE